MKKANPSLQFVQDSTLREQMRNGMTLRAYAAYPHKHHDWHGSASNRQSFYLTGLAGGGLKGDRAEARKVA